MSYRPAPFPTLEAADATYFSDEFRNIANAFTALQDMLPKGVLTFTTLPNIPIVGMLRVISDSNTNVWGAVAAGGGANQVLVWYNGTNWTVAGV